MTDNEHQHEHSLTSTQHGDQSVVTKLANFACCCMQRERPPRKRRQISQQQQKEQLHTAVTQLPAMIVYRFSKASQLALESQSAVEDRQSVQGSSSENGHHQNTEKED